MNVTLVVSYERLLPSTVLRFESEGAECANTENIKYKSKSKQYLAKSVGGGGFSPLM